MKHETYCTAKIKMDAYQSTYSVTVMNVQPWANCCGVKSDWTCESESFITILHLL